DSIPLFGAGSPRGALGHDVAGYRAYETILGSDLCIDTLISRRCGSGGAPDRDSGRSCRKSNTIHVDSGDGAVLSPAYPPCSHQFVYEEGNSTSCWRISSSAGHRSTSHLLSSRLAEAEFSARDPVRNVHPLVRLLQQAAEGLSSRRLCYASRCTADRATAHSQDDSADDNHRQGVTCLGGAGPEGFEPSTFGFP